MGRLHVRHTFVLFLLLFFIVIPILAQETTQEPVVPTETPLPSSTLEPTFTAIPTNTSTEVPTATPLPTETVTELPTVTLWPTETASPTAIETATEMATEELPAAYGGGLVGGSSGTTIQSGETFVTYIMDFENSVRNPGEIIRTSSLSGNPTPPNIRSVPLNFFEDTGITNNYASQRKSSITPDHAATIKAVILLGSPQNIQNLTFNLGWSVTDAQLLSGASFYATVNYALNGYYVFPTAKRCTFTPAVGQAINCNLGDLSASNVNQVEVVVGGTWTSTVTGSLEWMLDNLRVETATLYGDPTPEPTQINCGGNNLQSLQGVRGGNGETRLQQDTTCPSPINVVVTTDGETLQGCSLIEAIREVNGEDTDCQSTISTVGKSEITFAPGITHIILRSPYPEITSYGANGLPVICCNVSINGGSTGVTIERFSAASDFRIMEVASGADVTIINLSIQNGIATNTGGGAILSIGGTVRIFNSILSHNSVSVTTGTTSTIPFPLGGAIYVYANTGGIYGGLELHNSIVINNSVEEPLEGISTGQAVGGGGIAVVNGAVRIVSTSIFNNDSYESANAVYIENPLPFDQSASEVHSSCIFNNGSGNTQADFVLAGLTASLDATGNYWGSPSGPNNGGETITGSLNPGSFLTDCSLGATQLIFAKYGTTQSGWNTVEQAIIIDGIEDVAQSFLKFATNPEFNPNSATVALQAHEIFHLVMGNITIHGEAYEEGDNSFNNGVCRANNGAIGTITCDTTLLQERPDQSVELELTKYAVVHELGHVFVSKTGGHGSGSFYDIFDGLKANRIDPDPINDREGTLVMGIRSVGSPFEVTGFDWWRGDRGWGSHAYPAPSTFQQNSSCFLDPDLSTTSAEREQEIDEAVADMFLNWVYSTIGEGGFQNTDWLTGTTVLDKVGNCPISEPARPLSDTSGDARLGFINAAMQVKLLTFPIGQ